MYYSLAFPQLFLHNRRPVPNSREEVFLKKQNLMTCKSCATPITASEWAYYYQGGKEHQIVDLSGNIQNIYLFKKAPGIETDETYFEEKTAFDGYAWTEASCSGCEQRIGYKYLGGANGKNEFFGILTDKIQESIKA